MAEVKPPEAKIDQPAVAAPAGPFMTEGENPSVAVIGGAPATLGGYSPDTSQPPLGDPMAPPLPNLPPTGLRK